MARLLNPYKIEWEYDGDKVVPKEVPGPHHAWFAPFHEAITSGMVDGGAAYGDRITDSGTVSENPASDSSEVGSNG
jgi:hypothetical protein